MNAEYIKKIAELWQQVAEKKTLDPVDPKALKGKHADRKDKDIDNDGDVDKSDEYLHNRRKAVSKAMKNESEDEMKPCPKCDGSMQNHDPDCPMADNDDDDDDMKDESSCGKKMKKEGDMSKDKAGHISEKLSDDDWVHINRVGSFNNPKKDSIVGYSKAGKNQNRAPKLKSGANSAMRVSVAKEKGYNIKESVEENAQVTKDRLKKKHGMKESVSHEKWGYGEVIETTENGFNVYFEHGVEFNVPESELVVLEKNYATRTKGATAPEGIMDKESPKSKEFAKKHDADSPELAADDAQGHEDATKAGRAVNNQAPTRGGEKRIGDKSIVNPVKGAVTKTTGKEG